VDSKNRALCGSLGKRDIEKNLTWDDFPVK